MTFYKEIINTFLVFGLMLFTLVRLLLLTFLGFVSLVFNRTVKLMRFCIKPITGPQTGRRKS